MHIKRIISVYLFAITIIIIIYPTVSFCYPQANEAITQYIIDLSKDIQNSIEKPAPSILSNSKGELKLRLLLSPWGELKDVYISESSGNTELDRLCLKSVWIYTRYQPFPEALGDEERWIDVPIIFDVAAKLALPEGDLGRTSSAATFLKDRGVSLHKVIYGLKMDEAVDIASENQMAAKIAKEEVALSRLKIREAKRALYPAASLNYMETTGQTTGKAEDFTDKEYKVKFEYPLYYGWRLKYAVSQALSNMKSSRYNYDKTLQDIRLEVEVAFYSYLATKANLKLQKSLLNGTKKIFETAKKRYDLGLSTRAEFLHVQSQLKQITYQVSSSENDTTLARLTLAQAMNIKDTKDMIDIDTDVESIEMLEPVDINISIDECMDVAFKYRPDLKAKEYSVEFNDYGYKIAQSKDQLKVDLTGSYGKSGGAYESESLTMGNDWYLGFKVSKPLGGNTFSTSYTKDKTSEKHGQTSRTESVSNSVELGLLDNLQSFSEKKSAEIALKKATEEFQKTKNAIFKEVKESYLNYKKGLLQARTNLNKIKQKEEELKIAKVRAELNEIPFSELIQSHMNLTDEKSYYIEALGSLYQSLARLNKATGYALFLDNETFRVAHAK